MNNWMDLDDFEKALLAICGMARMSKYEDADMICNLAVLYQAMESGSLQALLAALNSMMGQAGFESFITAEMIQAAMQTGDLEGVLKAAAQAARSMGDMEAANMLNMLALTLNGLEDGDISCKFTLVEI